MTLVWLIDQAVEALRVLEDMGEAITSLAIGAARPPQQRMKLAALPAAPGIELEEDREPDLLACAPDLGVESIPDFEFEQTLSL